MRLEDEIHSKFSSDFHKLTVSILYTHGRLVSVMSEVLKSFDLTLQQFNVLRILRGQRSAPVTVSLLKERMLDKMSDASRLVERLRVKGLVERGSSSGDRRKASIQITQKGLDLLERIGDFDAILRAIASGVSEDEARQVNAVLDRFREALGSGEQRA